METTVFVNLIFDFVQCLCKNKYKSEFVHNEICTVFSFVCLLQITIILFTILQIKYQIGI